jgi:glutathione S-transferase
MDWTATTLQPAIMGLFWGFYRTPAPLRDASANARLVADCAQLIRRLDDWLAQRRFVAGATFSMADIPAGALMHRYFEMQIERPAAPAIDAWRARLAEGKPYKDNILQPFDELFGRLAY